MTNIKIPGHDYYIKSVFSDPKVASDFFRNHLPDKIKEKMDFSTLTPQKVSFVSDSLRLQMADLLFSIKMEGKTAYTYILMEHASTPDKLLAFRILKYMTQIMDMHLNRYKTKQLPYIFPLIFHTGNRPYTYSTDLFDLFGEYKELAQETLYSPYKLIDLYQASDEDLERYKWFKTAALVAKHIHDPDLLPFLNKIIEVLRDLEKSGKQGYISATLSYIVEKGEVSDKQQFFKSIAQGLQMIDEDKAMTIAEELRKEGGERGIQKGIQQGMQQISLNMLLEGEMPPMRWTKKASNQETNFI